jgi:hypothetical protein
MNTTVFFKSASGVHPVTLPVVEALLATRKHPHEYSLTRYGFADPPEDWQPSTDESGGLGRVQGAGVRAD